MLRKHTIVSAGGFIILSLVILNIIIIKAGFANNENWYWALTVSLPLLLLAIFNIRQKKHALLRNFPLIGYVRYFLESIIKEQKMKKKQLLLECRQTRMFPALNGQRILSIRKKCK